MHENDWNELESRPQLECTPHLGEMLRPGDRVRLWPRRGADIMDLVLRGKTATIEAIEQDYEETIHLAVVIEDDPGRDLGLLRQPGHRFFFTLEEIEPLPDAENQS